MQLIFLNERKFESNSNYSSTSQSHIGSVVLGYYNGTVYNLYYAETDKVKRNKSAAQKLSDLIVETFISDGLTFATKASSKQKQIALCVIIDVLRIYYSETKDRTKLMDGVSAMQKSLDVTDPVGALDYHEEFANCLTGIYPLDAKIGEDPDNTTDEEYKNYQVDINMINEILDSRFSVKRSLIADDEGEGKGGNTSPVTKKSRSDETVSEGQMQIDEEAANVNEDGKLEADVEEGTGSIQSNDSDEHDDQTRKGNRETSEPVKEADFETILLNAIELCSEATIYEGFSPSAIRKAVLSKFENKNNYATVLVYALIIYIRVGNNIGKITEKRKDSDKINEMLKDVSILSVKKSARNKEDLTYPRIAIAFMPELLVMRKYLITDLQIQVNCLLSSEYHDLAFAGCNHISEMNGYSEFYKAFSKLIVNGGKGYSEQDIKDGKDKSDTERWLDVSKKGYVADIEIHSRITEAHKVKDKKGAAAFIIESYEAYGKK
jgi:hypothetical protein